MVVLLLELNADDLTTGLSPRPFLRVPAQLGVAAYLSVLLVSRLILICVLRTNNSGILTGTHGSNRNIEQCPLDGQQRDSVPL